MEAEISSPSASPGVPGPLRGVLGPGGAQFITHAFDGANHPQSSSDQLHFNPESNSRRAWLASADRSDATGALPADLAFSMLANRELQPAIRLQKVCDHFDFVAHQPS